MKPTGRIRSSGLRISSRTTRRPPSPAPTTSTSRVPLGARMLRIRPSGYEMREEAHAREQRQHQQQERHRNADGQADAGPVVGRAVRR